MTATRRRRASGRATAWIERVFALATVCVTASACVDGGPDGPPDGPPDDVESRWPLVRTCVAPEGMGRPATIEDVVTLVNALPRPTSLPCVLESLDRPLAVYASSSTAGAQPAHGARSPRIFLFRGDLTMSVVPEGTGAETLELSYAIGNRRSIKAELVFPVEQPLAPSAPYDAVDLGAGTTCGGCHGAEARVAEIDFARAWASDVYQDDPDQSVPSAFLRQHALDCEPELEPERCEQLDAIFGHGDVEARDLPRDSKICRGP